MKTFVAVFLAIIAVVVLSATLAHTTTRRLTVFYPESWPQGEYRSCTADLNYVVLDCSAANSTLTMAGRPSNGPTAILFTMDVKFSGKTSGQSWTCLNVDHSLTCKN